MLKLRIELEKTGDTAEILGRVVDKTEFGFTRCSPLTYYAAAGQDAEKKYLRRNAAAGQDAEKKLRQTVSEFHSVDEPALFPADSRAR